MRRIKTMCNFAPTNMMRGGAEAARWAHNPKVAGSSPAPATKKAGLLSGFLFLFFHQCHAASNAAIQ